MPTVEVECRACQSYAVYRHGKASSGEQRYRCQDCGHCFQLTYRYNGNEPVIADRITGMAMNGSGIRDTSRFLCISQNIKRLARKTICFSKLEEVHDKVIGEYISRQFFQLV